LGPPCRIWYCRAILAAASVASEPPEQKKDAFGFDRLGGVGYLIAAAIEAGEEVTIEYIDVETGK